jgi:hypothetical protein
VTPITVQDPPVSIHVLEKRRPREGRHPGSLQTLDVGFQKEIERTREHIWRVVVPPEDEARIDCDARLVQPSHRGAVVLADVAMLPPSAQARL